MTATKTKTLKLPQFIQKAPIPTEKVIESFAYLGICTWHNKYTS